MAYPKPPRGRPWPKGVSGNPGGMPKAIRDITILAREHSAAAFLRIVAMSKDPKLPAAARERANEYICNRGWGLPTTNVAFQQPDDFRELTLAELTLIAAEAIPQRDGGGNTSPQDDPGKLN